MTSVNHHKAHEAPESQGEIIREWQPYLPGFEPEFAVTSNPLLSELVRLEYDLARWTEHGMPPPQPFRT